MDTVPTGGDMDHITLVLLEPVTVACNAVDCPPLSDAVVGDTETVTVEAAGTSEITAVSLLLASAALVALTAMVCAEAMVAGAV